MAAIPLVRDETYYPDSDGEPVAETPIHFEEMVYVWEILDERFEDDPEVFVGANMFLYYRRGDPRAVVAPDGFVVKGVPKLPGGEMRRKYLLWEEGQVPCFVLETISESTYQQDRNKRTTYAQLGVTEYFQFDPLGECLRPPLQGFRLVNGLYEPLPPNSDGSLLSQATGVVFRPDGMRLRLTDAVTGAPLLRRKELREAKQQAEKRAAAEAEARRQSEEKAAAEAEARRQAEEKAAAEAEARVQAEEKAATEAEARRRAEDRLRALEEEIALLRRSSGGS